MPKIRFKTFPSYIMMTLFNEKIIARCMVGATLLCMPMSHNEMKALKYYIFMLYYLCVNQK